MKKSMILLFSVIFSLSVIVLPPVNVSAGNILPIETGNEAELITDYILVLMEHEYSFPDKPYNAEYFNDKYVSEVEPITYYTENSLWNYDTFQMVIKLCLTEFGKENTEEFINILNARHDIAAAGFDYWFHNGSLTMTDDRTNGNITDNSDLTADAYMSGDVDHDDAVTVKDARQVLRWAIGLDSMTNLGEVLSDVDYSGTVDVNDAKIILNIAIGNIPQVD